MDQGQARTVLADALERSVSQIVRLWLERVRRELPGKELSNIELRDAIPHYLRSLAAELRQRVPREPMDCLDGDTAWSQVAEEHGITRVRQGFDIEELVREFMVLRRVVIAVLQEQGLLEHDCLRDEIADLIDGAVAASQRSYVASRDYQARRVEAEHIAFVTHELRNPLSAAMMATAGLRRQLPAGAHDDSLDTLERSHQRLKHLIDNVISAERLATGVAAPRPSDTTLGAIMEVAVRAAQARAREKHIELEVAIDEQLRLYVDPNLTISILQNLIDNAVKYTDWGRIQVTSEERPSELVVHVRDNCDGMSPEELAVMYEPFVRGRSHGKPGSGLGLSIAQRAAEAQGGTLAAESPGERGCHFWVTLPKRVGD